MKHAKRALSIALVLMLMLAAVPIWQMPVSATSIEDKLKEIDAELAKTFTNRIFSVDGKNCYISGTGHECSNCRLSNILAKRLGGNTLVPNKTSEGHSCVGFAKYVFCALFGTTKGTQDYTAGSASSAATYAKMSPGDYFYTSKHTMIFVSQSGNKVKVYDCNGAGTLRFGFNEYTIGSGNLTGTVNVWHSTNAPTTHTHAYTEYAYYWASHPHYKCYRCSCGDVKENRNETVFVDTCEECKKTVSGSYAYNATEASSYATKYATSYNSSYKSYGDNDCANFVSQCLRAGGIPTDSTWAPYTSAWIGCGDLYRFLVNNGYGTSSTVTTSSKAPKAGDVIFMYSGGYYTHVYICHGTNSSGVPLLAAHTNDVVNKTFSSCLTGYTYYLVSMKTGNTSGPGKSTLTANVSTTTANSKITFNWTAASGATSYNLQYQYQDGTLHVVKNGMSGSTYTYTTSFSEPGTYKFYINSVNASGYTKSDYCTVVILPATYTVTYNANGGSGAPAAQTKNYGQTLTLSEQEPVREDYLFQGWAATATATAAQYAAGDPYTMNENVTLYAVWKSFGSVTGITITSLPHKTAYAVGEKLDVKGLALQASYSSGVKKTVTSGFTVSGFSSATEGQKTVTVAFGGKTATFNVTVSLPDDWTDWIPADQLPDVIKNAPAGTYDLEYADGYQTRQKETTVNGYASYDGWTQESKTTVSTTTGAWQLTAPAASNVQSDTYHTVVTVSSKTAQVSHAYVTADNKTYWYEDTSQYGSTKYTQYLKVYSSVGVASTGYTKDTSDGSYFCPSSIGLANPGKFGTIYLMTNKGSSISSFTSGKSNIFLWPNGTATVYQAVTTKYQYSHYRWSDWSDLSPDPVTGSSTREVQTVNNGLVRYKKAAPAVYTVSYNANGGIGAPAAQTKTERHDLTLQTSAPTRVDYIFTGWNTKADGSGVTYQPGDTFTVDANTVLYATWRAVSVALPMGDVNGDGEIDAADAGLISRYDAGFITLNDAQLQAGDVNGDGEVDAADAGLISRYDAGFISHF